MFSTQNRSSRLGMFAAASALTLIPLSTPANAQSLTYAQAADFSSMDPAIVPSTVTHVLFRHVFNGLVRWSDPSEPRIVPDLATVWETSKDGLQWTFTLREGVIFHDATPFDAHAVKFNIDRLMAKATGSPVHTQLGPIREVVVVDPMTVRFDLNAPMPTLLEILVDEYASINSPTAVTEMGDQYATKPVGTGPYRFVEWRSNELGKIERYDGYHGTPGLLEEIIFRPIPEGAARAIELETGNVDVAANIPPELAASLDASDSADLLVIPSSFQIFFDLNLSRAPFNDHRMIEAARLAIDREAIIASILGGYGVVATGPFPEGVPGRVEMEPHVYDPERAKALIDEVYPDGFQETLVIWTPAGRYTKDKEVAEAVQGYLNAAGFKTEFKTWEWATYLTVLSEPAEGGTKFATNDANMWLVGTGITNPDRRLRTKYDANHPEVNTGYFNAEIQAMFDQVAIETDYDARMAIYGEIQKRVWNDHPNNIPLFNMVQLIGVRAGMAEPKVFADEIILFDQIQK